MSLVGGRKDIIVIITIMLIITIFSIVISPGSEGEARERLPSHELLVVLFLSFNISVIYFSPHVMP